MKTVSLKLLVVYFSFILMMIVFIRNIRSIVKPLTRNSNSESNKKKLSGPDSKEDSKNSNQKKDPKLSKKTLGTVKTDEQSDKQNISNHQLKHIDNGKNAVEISDIKN